MTLASGAVAASDAERYLNRDLAGPRLDQLRLDNRIARQAADPLMLRSKVHPSLRGVHGMREVVVRLHGPSVGRMTDRDRFSRIGRKYQLESEQAAFIQRGRARVNMQVMAQTQMVLNAVFAEVDAADLEALAADPAVERIAPVANYQLHLSETVPYIGASRVQAAGFDGSGVTVAVLDSGIDYTHQALGGPGTLDAYDAAYTDPASRDGLFPTDKVVEGTDLVGETWDGIEATTLEPDDDPIDAGGHGTHVADIIGGALGVASGVDLLAVKVCSAISTACSGIALIQGMEYAVDPNGDGDTEDAVDIIHMSLGSDYGQPFDDDLSQAVQAAEALGVLTVASAGNGADKPYVVGTPASTPAALAVAQTQVPSATVQLLSQNGSDYPAVFQPWSVAPEEVISGPLQYGDGAGGNLDGCLPFESTLEGLVVLVDRGDCNFTAKISNISQAGGVVGIIGLIAPGAPFGGGDGGERPIDIPGYMINQADATALKNATDPTVTVDPANQLSLVGQMVGSSSRGPQHESTTLIKPEIGAPGASVSAEVGTGDGTTAFSGTSGAAPMVTGSAALLLQKDPTLSTTDVKARLVNTAESAIDTDPFTGLAPITRIGGGEVRVDRAARARFAAWDDGTGQAALGFGFHDISRQSDALFRTVRIRNYRDRPIWLRLNPTFRFDDDAANGAVSVYTLPWVRLEAKSDAVIPVIMQIDGEALRENAMSSGADGANADALTFNEYDGYLELTGAGQTAHLPWHVLPRKAAKVIGRTALEFHGDFDQLTLFNAGVGTAQVDGYALLAVSPDLAEGGPGEQSPVPDIRAIGVNTFPVPAGFCSDDPSFVWAFAINTWERQQHLLPVSHQVVLDIDRDGEDDFVVLNRDLSGLGTIGDGRQVTYAFNLATGDVTAFFFTEHAMNTGNTVLFVCGEQVGLTGTDMLNTLVDMDVIAQDFYYGGPSDIVEGLVITPLGEQHFPEPEDIPAWSSGSVQVTDFGPFPGTTQELGVLLFTNGDRGEGLHGGATERSEALLLFNKAVVPSDPFAAKPPGEPHGQPRRAEGRNAWRNN